MNKHFLYYPEFMYILCIYVNSEENFMMSHISKWGNSLGLRIPQLLAQQMHIKKGDTVKITIDEKHNRIIIQKKQLPKYDLKSLLEQVNDKNLHDSVEWGSPRGKEIW